MNNNNVHSLRRLLNIILFLLFVALSGCASSPEEYEVVTEPVEETAPPAEAPAPAIVAPAEPITLAPNHPERYVVVKGDTLWDISGRFLRDPWRWPEVWQGNPQVTNPHLIFPGDVLRLYIIDGRPVMQVERGEVAISAGVTDGGATAPRVPTDAAGRPLRVVKLSPQVRAIDLEKAIPIIPMDAISQFLERSVVADESQLDDAPYVVSLADEHVAGGSGYRLYARGIEEDAEVDNFTVVRPGKEYVDPDSGEYLGKEALYLARAELVREGDPATLTLSAAKREVLRGDRLLQGEPETFNFSFMPHAPSSEVKGRIISVFDAVNQIGQHQVVVLSVGKRDGMEPGHVLAVLRDGETVKDPVRGGRVKLPDERAGTVIIFRTFDKVSYALVTSATRAMHLGDRVKNP
ncbi:MAG TPA: LysM peptidoglycan-binding domain-containing protein [Gammaproteobacteria bacterium]